MKHSMVPAAYTIIRNSRGKILAVLRKNTGYMDNCWSLPAGHVEIEELPIKGAVREVKEEVGVIVKPEDLRFVHIMIRPKRDKTGERVDIFFETSRWQGKPRNMETKKHSQVDWVEISDKVPWMPFQKSALLDIARGISYSELKD